MNKKTKNSPLLPSETEGEEKFSPAGIPPVTVASSALAPDILSLTNGIVGYFSIDFKIIGKQFSLKGLEQQ